MPGRDKRIVFGVNYRIRQNRTCLRSRSPVDRRVKDEGSKDGLTNICASDVVQTIPQDT